MKFEAGYGNAEDKDVDVYVQGVYKEDLKNLNSLFDKKLSFKINSIVKSGEFNADFDNKCMLHLESSKAKRLLLLGLGKKSELDLKKIRTLIARTTLHIKHSNLKSYAINLLRSEDKKDSFEDVVYSHVTMALFSTYEFNKYKTVDKKSRTQTKKEIQKIILLCEKPELNHAKKAIHVAKAVSESMNSIRDLVNGPSNDVTPTVLANYAKAIAKKNKMKCTVFGKKEIQKMKMHAFLGVAKGSQEEPKFIILEHKPKVCHGKISVVGKGITFDSGGISLKPSKNMGDMKMDMGGAAATLGILDAVSKLNLPVHVYGVIPTCENMPSGSAQKPGDIVKTMSGKTVEIGNTDAEGRLILADALYYTATKIKPDAIIDLATLTGAVLISLGVHATGLFTNDDILLSRMKVASRESGEAVWHLPTWDDYQEDVKSEFADIKNMGLPMEAGSITAAMFLKFFVEKTPWVHLDIAGTAWTDARNMTCIPGATGSGVRLVTKFIENLGKK